MKRFLVAVAALACIPAYLGTQAFGQSAAASAASSSAPKWSICASGVAGAKSITLAPGCHEYLYVGSTSGAAPMSAISWRSDLKVTAISATRILGHPGELSVSIGHASANTGSYKTLDVNFAVAGVGTTGGDTLRAFSQASMLGPGCPGCGVTRVPGPRLSLSFSISRTSRVLILVGGQGTGSLTLSGIHKTRLRNRTFSEGGGCRCVFASVAIYVATLKAGTYTAQLSSTTTLDNTNESLGAAAYVSS